MERNFGKKRFGNYPREEHEVTCSDCGEKAKVPFKPSPNRKVYCRACWEKHRDAGDL